MCDKCDYEDYLETMKEMLDDTDYDFALETIEGIYNWVESKEHITDKQKEAINNIKESVENV